ncbi:MAG: type IX secretion system plug protein domain-containing protein [Cyclobacteriaceae bacterium]
MIKNTAVFFIPVYFLLADFIIAQEIFEDKVFDNNIQTVQLFPSTNDFSAQMTAPVIALNNPFPLVLHFDDIAYEADMYSAKIIHCNADWTKSGLRDADYLQQYNEYNVNQYDYGINTRIPYIHYTFEVPQVKRSGNYILQVYRGRDPSKTVFTKRFMVYQNQVALGANIVPPSLNEDRRTSQQININVNYGNRDIVDPLNSTMVVIRQNQRWDNAIYGLKFTSIRDDRSELQYQLFDGSNTFLAGNEFRFVDLRYVRTRGRNIAGIRMEEDAVFAEAGVDEIRKGQGYLEYLDLNGQYGIFNVERQNHLLESEYVLLTFKLDTEELASPPYVLGALSNWGKVADSKMVYDKGKGQYQATLFLKQGWYDYQFGLAVEDGWNTEFFEGTHFQTENEYEVFFYYRDMGSRYDELIGYTVLNPNKRRF